MKGKIVLLTGISGSGKTTLGCLLQKKWGALSKTPVDRIDGDQARGFLDDQLGYSEEERFLVTKMMAYAAFRLASSGVHVVFSNIAGKQIVRDFLKEKWGDFFLIHLDADVRDCIINDPRGVYERAMALETPSFMGLDIPYERPENPDLILYPHVETVDESLKKILTLLESKKGFF